MSEELLRCPFCGSAAIADSHADDCYFTLHRALNKSPSGDASLQLEVLKAWNRRAAASRASLEAVPEGWTPASGMTAHRAAFFMERFKREEKLLGPNEQAAVDFVLAMLSAAPAQPAQQSERTALEQYDLEHSDDYQKGWDDGRKKGYEFGYRHGTEAHLFSPANTDQPAQQERQPMTEEQWFQSELFKLAVQKGLLTLHKSFIAELTDPRTSVTWMEGHEKACDISNEAFERHHGIRKD